jgi:hypothetical protein
VLEAARPRRINEVKDADINIGSKSDLLWTVDCFAFPSPKKRPQRGAALGPTWGCVEVGAATRRSNSRPDELFPEQLFNTFGYHAFAPSLSGAPDPNEKKPRWPASGGVFRCRGLV